MEYLVLLHVGPSHHLDHAVPAAQGRAAARTPDTTSSWESVAIVESRLRSLQSPAMQTVPFAPRLCTTYRNYTAVAARSWRCSYIPAPLYAVRSIHNKLLIFARSHSLSAFMHCMWSIIKPTSQTATMMVPCSGSTRRMCTFSTLCAREDVRGFEG